MSHRFFNGQHRKRVAFVVFVSASKKGLSNCSTVNPSDLATRCEWHTNFMLTKKCLARSQIYRYSRSRSSTRRFQFIYQPHGTLSIYRIKLPVIKIVYNIRDKYNTSDLLFNSHAIYSFVRNI